MREEPIQWLDWDAVRWDRGKNLPHLQQRRAVYFITFRLWDSLPQEKLAQWKSELARWDAANPSPHTPVQQRQRRQLSVVRIERYLDAGHGCCVLGKGDARTPIVDTLLHDDDQRYRLRKYVIMPNHVHLLVQMAPDADMRDVCDQWKSVSAHKINKLLGRSGHFWQTEPFDHIVRNPEQFRECERYIEDNPRFLPPDQFMLGQGSLKF